jgi:hypothetical protein
MYTQVDGEAATARSVVPAAANAASAVLGAGAAPLGSIGSIASAAGAAGGGAAARVPTSLAGEEEASRDDAADPEGQQPGEQLV